MNGSVVVDASLAFKWLVEEEYSDRAHESLQSWERKRTHLAAPYLMIAEVTNALHRRVLRGELTIGDAGRLLGNLMSVGIELHETLDLHRRALALASQLDQGAAYDAHYLALAETLDCELWTADEKFFRAAGTAVENVRWIGEFAPG